MRSSHLGFYLVDKRGIRENVGRGFSGLAQEPSAPVQPLATATGQEMMGGLGKTLVFGLAAAIGVWYFFLR